MSEDTQEPPPPAAIRWRFMAIRRGKTRPGVRQLAAPRSGRYLCAYDRKTLNNNALAAAERSASVPNCCRLLKHCPGQTLTNS